MKKLYFLKTMLLLCALVVGSASVWAASEWTYTFDSSSKVTKNADNTINGVVWNVTTDAGYWANDAGGLHAGSNSQNASYITLKTSGISGTIQSVKVNARDAQTNATISVSVGGNAYSCSGTTSVTNTASDFTFTGTKSGEIIISVTRTSSMSKAIYVRSITITYETDSREDAGLSYDPESVTLELDEAFTAPTFSNPNDLTVSYSSDNEDVATVNATSGVISFVGGLGTAVITATSEADETYKAGLATFTINVVRKTPTLTVADDFGMKTGESVTIDDDIYLTDADGAVTVTSGTPSVISVAEGKLNALTTGSAVITVSVAQGETYAATSETFTITVTANPAVAPEGEGVGSGYTLVTDASTLADGDKIIIVSGSKAMSTTQNTNNRGETAVTVSSNTISSISNTVQVITLEGSTGSWDFNVGDGYLYAASSTNNHLKKRTTANGDTKASISISSGTATIKFLGDYTHNLLKHNSGSSCFSCYASGNTQDDIKIYRQNVATSYDITIGEAGWRTLVSALDVTLPEGLTAYTAKVSGDKAMLTQVTEIAKNQPYLLSGYARTYTLTKASSNVTAPTDNDLAISDATTGNGIFVLAKRNNVVGFYKWNGGYIGAGRVYLPASAGAREFIGFDDETAGISSMHNSQCIMHNEVYDLQGRRVESSIFNSQSSILKKGLYIVNGKKVIK